MATVFAREGSRRSAGDGYEAIAGDIGGLFYEEMRERSPSMRTFSAMDAVFFAHM